MKNVSLSILVLGFLFSSMAQSNGLPFKVGVGRADITGPSLGLSLMGYGKITQGARGIESRLKARAFVVESKSSQKRIVYVVVDMGMVSQLMKIEVVNRLQKEFGELYTDSNVLISATHTHSAPGGFFGSSFYNVSIFGFNKANFEIIVSGIIDAIRQGHVNMKDASISVMEGDLERSSVNRAREAYAANQSSSLRLFTASSNGSVHTEAQDEVNKKMTLLRFDDQEGKAIGVLNWYAIHGTSVGNKNDYVSADNKGVAAVLFENWSQSVAQSNPGLANPGLVAGFANSEAGDVSPNIPEFIKPDGSSIHEFERSQATGRMQFRKAAELFKGSGQKLSGDLAYEHVWVRMPGLKVMALDGKEARLCKAAYGISFGAGVKFDGPSNVPGLHEGMRADNYDFSELPLVTKALLNFLNGLDISGHGDDDPCHFPKAVLFPAGSHKPEMVPSVLPFQIMRIGEFAIAAVPAELTTVAGLYIKESLLSVLAQVGVKEVVLAGYANTYSGYVVTPDEYQVQGYEGASTLFGPNTLLGYEKALRYLAQNMVNRDSKTELQEAVTRPPFKIDPVISTHSKTNIENLATDEQFGQVLSQPRSRYKIGDKVAVEFRAAYREDAEFLKAVPVYFEIQRREPNGEFITVATDSDVVALLKWQIEIWNGKRLLKARIVWNPSSDTVPGTYRILHHGVYGEGNGPQKYSGMSRSFVVGL